MKINSFTPSPQIRFSRRIPDPGEHLLQKHLSHQDAMAKAKLARTLQTAGEKSTAVQGWLDGVEDSLASFGKRFRDLFFLPKTKGAVTQRDIFKMAKDSMFLPER